MPEGGFTGGGRTPEAGRAGVGEVIGLKVPVDELFIGAWPLSALPVRVAPAGRKEPVSVTGLGAAPDTGL
jgi:hypothetical protein